MDLESAFPHLSTSEIDAMRGMGEEQRFAPGEFLWQAGEAEMPFYIIIEGRVRIVESSTGETRLVVVHEPGSFTGDVDMLTGRPAFVSAVAQTEALTLRIDFKHLRRVLNELPWLGEKFIIAFQTRRKLLQDSAFIGIKVVGSARETIEIREFLYKNSAPCTWFDVDTDLGKKKLAYYKEKGVSECPIVHCGQDRLLQKPTLQQIADCAGIRRPLPNKRFGLVIVGAGPAGLAAAVYATSEGIDTVILDTMGPGGQAGTTSRIENFIGFPAGLSGGDLANRAQLQVLKFGGIISAPVTVTDITSCEDRHTVHLDTGETICTDCVLLATGVRYRFLDADGDRRYMGAGIYHACTSVEAQLCSSLHVVIVGAGNSAGQAAVYMTEHAQSVKMVVRADTHAKGMSNYLATRISAISQIEVITESEVTGVSGDGCLQDIEVTHGPTGEKRSLPCAALFVFIGADPNTEWLPKGIELDDKGYIKTGPAAKDSPLWNIERAPCPLETTVPGIFAAGDVRSGNTRRVAFAAGDGALAVTCVNQYRAKL